jgi:predicted DNA-binding ribbon-helix-helix protein
VRNVMRRWDSLASVAKAHQLNVNMLIAKGEGIKMTEVSAWADANRQ